MGIFRTQHSAKLAETGPESGVALPEFLLTAPFLLIMCAGVIDVGMALTHYVKLSEAAHSGLRLAISHVQLDPGVFIAPDCPACPGCQPAALSAAHDGIVGRVEDMVRVGRNRLDLSSLCLVSEVGASPTEPTRQMITLTLRADYQAIFPGVSRVPISVRVSGPLLN